MEYKILSLNLTIWLWTAKQTTALGARTNETFLFQAALESTKARKHASLKILDMFYSNVQHCGDTWVDYSSLCGASASIYVMRNDFIGETACLCYVITKTKITTSLELWSYMAWIVFSEWFVMVSYNLQLLYISNREKRIQNLWERIRSGTKIYIWLREHT